MVNAYRRLGRLEYHRSSQKNQTHISVHVDRYVGEKGQAHLVSAFGNDAEVGAITAAIQEGHTFEITFPDGSNDSVGFGKQASCHKGALKLPDMKRPVRHLVAVSSLLQANGSAGNTFILNYRPETVELAWSTLVSFMGLPADPRWGGYVLAALEREGKIDRLRGIGCEPAIIRAVRDDMLKRLGRTRATGVLPFPDRNGPVLWPRYTIQQALLPS
jgi:hypothetical protein